jgi:hypothetical protein
MTPDLPLLPCLPWEHCLHILETLDLKCCACPLVLTYEAWLTERLVEAHDATHGETPWNQNTS